MRLEKSSDTGNQEGGSSVDRVGSTGDHGGRVGGRDGSCGLGGLGRRNDSGGDRSAVLAEEVAAVDEDAGLASRVLVGGVAAVAALAVAGAGSRADLGGRSRGAGALHDGLAVLVAEDGAAVDDVALLAVGVLVGGVARVVAHGIVLAGVGAGRLGHGAVAQEVAAVDGVAGLAVGVLVGRVARVATLGIGGAGGRAVARAGEHKAGSSSDEDGESHFEDVEKEKVEEKLNQASVIVKRLCSCNETGI